MNLLSRLALRPARIEEVVFDGVAGARDVGVLEAANGAHEVDLHVERQAGRDAVRIHLVRVEAFGLDEDLMRGPVREARHLVFDRGTIARSHALDEPGEHRRARTRAADDVVGALVGRRDVAGDLPRMLRARAEVGEYRPRIVAVLLAQPRVVDAAAVDARRRAGLQPPDLERQLAQPRGERERGRIAGAAAGVALESDVNAAAEERAHGEHHVARGKLDAAQGDAADDAVSLERAGPRLPAGRARGSAASRVGGGSRACRAGGRPARASHAPPVPCWRSGCETGCPRHPPRAPWRRRARRFP